MGPACISVEDGGVYKKAGKPKSYIEHLGDPKERGYTETC
jgi:hypothetical protein